MIKTEIYESALFDTVKRGATEISPDVKKAFEEAIERESYPDAKKGLIATLESMEKSKVLQNPLCVDTGWPIFYFKVGNSCVLEGGFVELENAARRAVERATKMGYLRATMKHPLTGYDPGNNIGMNIPDFTYQFVEGALSTQVLSCSVVLQALPALPVANLSTWLTVLSPTRMR